jgi:hypothetical protein
MIIVANLPSLLHLSKNGKQKDNQGEDQYITNPSVTLI